MTLREHLEAIRREISGTTIYGSVYDHAAAALDLLDAAPVHVYPIAHGDIEARRVVPDPIVESNE